MEDKIGVFICTGYGIAEALECDGVLPFCLGGQTLFYAGPTPPRGERAVGFEFGGVAVGGRIKEGSGNDVRFIREDGERIDVAAQSVGSDSGFR